MKLIQEKGWYKTVTRNASILILSASPESELVGQLTCGVQRLC